MTQVGPIVVGLLGGIGSGKSTVGRIFRELGAEVIEADGLVHRFLREPRVRRRLAAALGVGLPEETSRLRRVLARRVFSSERERKLVEEVLHPLVEHEIRERLKKVRPGAVVVLDVPLLVEAGLDRYCSRFVFVDAPESVRAERVHLSRGWRPEEFRAREGAQMELTQKRSLADWIIDNGHDPAATREQVESVWSDLLSPRDPKNVRRISDGESENQN